MPAALPALRRWLALAACLLGLALAPALAHAQPGAASAQPPSKAQPKKRAARGARLKAAPKVTYANGQTLAQRQRSEAARLRRECKGRPNAGACLGHAR